jgi:hypothetical protein
MGQPLAKDEMAFRQSKEDEPMADFPFVNDASQAERKRVIENDRKASSYMAHAATNVDEDRGGRYAAIGSSPRVIGAAPVSYPTQPEGSPWHSDPVPPEMPLGFSVEDHDPVGEKHELGGDAVASAAPNSQFGLDTADVAAAAAQELKHHVDVAAAVSKSRGWRRL